jgi:hypothetical protein
MYISKIFYFNIISGDIVNKNSNNTVLYDDISNSKGK